MKNDGHTEKAFLEAILTQPRNEGIRRVFSFWLDEQGEHDRATFIRLQCYPSRFSLSTEQRKKHVAREKKLLLEHHEEWLGPLAQLRQPPSFKGGFPNLSRLTDLNDMEYQIVAASPYLLLTEILQIKTSTSANAISDKSTQILADSPYLGHITDLCLSRVHISPAGVQNLLEAPYMERLDSLGLDGEGAEDSEYTCANLDFITPYFDLDHVEAVATSPFATRLTTLTLRFNRLEDTAAEALLASPYLDHLRCLHMYLNAISRDAIMALRERFGICIVHRVGS